MLESLLPYLAVNQFIGITKSIGLLVSYFQIVL